MITRRHALQLIGLGGAVAAGTSRRGRAAELDEVKIGTPLVISDAPIVIAEAKGYCRDVGIRTTVINLVTGSQMVAPLGAGQIDIAAAATSAGLFNAAARGIGLRIVADKAPTCRAMPMCRSSCARNWSIPGNSRRSRI